MSMIWFLSVHNRLWGDCQSRRPWVLFKGDDVSQVAILVFKVSKSSPMSIMTQVFNIPMVREVYSILMVSES